MSLSAPGLGPPAAQDRVIGPPDPATLCKAPARANSKMRTKPAWIYRERAAAANGEPARG